MDRVVKYYYDDKICFPDDWNDFPLELEARVGLEQLKKYDSIIINRINNTRKYIEKFACCRGIKVLPFFEGATYSHFVALVEDRRAWLEKYRSNGLQLGTLIEYAIPYLKMYANYKRREYPIAKYYSENIVNFPIYRTA